MASRSIERLTFAAAIAVLLAGIASPTARYLSPQSGVGYALGITGGVMMLALLVYPARKRIQALAFIGGVPQWFRIHMILGVLGPICILFHSNFRLGAANSNVALVCMSVVAVSGIVGRYFYSRIHHGLYGRKATLAELQKRAELLGSQSPALPMLPELMERLAREEAPLLAEVDSPAIRLHAPILHLFLVQRARRRLRRYVRPALHAAAAQSRTIAAQRQRIEHAVLGYVNRRLDAARRAAEFRLYERLFSLWHVLHLPLFFMMLAAGVVHVIAVHVY